MSSDAMTFTLPSPATWTGALLLPEMGVLQGTGPDTASFLHGQLSQDVLNLDVHQARLAAYCSAKGRILASTIALKPQADTVWLLCDHSVLPALHKRLSMFVLRAKTALTNAEAHLRVIGLVGDAAQALIAAELPTVASPAPTAIAAPWPVQAWHGGQLVALPTVLGVARWLWVGPDVNADALLALLPTLPAPAWSWLDVMSAVPRIQAVTADQFVPQMVNFELVGGVNFQKGCYPGQEVVARSQYRGTVKRRAVLVHSAAPLQAGQEVFADSDPSQPAGLVVQAAPIPASDGLTVGGAHSALIEVKLAALGTPVRAAAGDGLGGTPLTWAEMPYSLDVGEGV